MVADGRIDLRGHLHSAPPQTAMSPSPQPARLAYDTVPTGERHPHAAQYCAAPPLTAGGVSRADGFPEYECHILLATRLLVLVRPLRDAQQKDSQREILVRVGRAAAGTSVADGRWPLGTGMMCRQPPVYLELSAEDDPFFLYNLTIDEKAFVTVKAEQNLLIEFATFSERLCELLNLVSGGPDGRVVAVLNIAADGISARFSLVERNQFRELETLGLNFPRAAEATLRRHCITRQTAMQREIALLSSRIDGLMVTVESERATRSHLEAAEQENKRQQAEIKEETEKLYKQKLEETSRADEKEKQELAAKICTLEEQIRKKSQDIIAREDREAEYKKSIEELNHKVNDFKGRNLSQSPQGHIGDETSSDVDQLRAEANDLREKLEQTIAEMARTIQAMNQLQNHNSLLKEKLREKCSLLKDIEKAAADLESVRSDREEAKRKCFDLESDNSSLSRRVSDLEKQLKSKQQVIDYLNKQLKRSELNTLSMRYGGPGRPLPTEKSTAAEATGQSVTTLDDILSEVKDRQIRELQRPRTWSTLPPGLIERSGFAQSRGASSLPPLSIENRPSTAEFGEEKTSSALSVSFGNILQPNSREHDMPQQAPTLPYET